MNLDQLLKKENNNIDILRLAAAMAVIVGHAYTIAPQPPLQDGVLLLLGFDYSGSLAVKFFFFLSGLLVAGSILKNGNLLGFLVARSLRLFPALIICVILTIVVLGIYPGILDYSSYLKRPETRSYLIRNVTLELQWHLPGVFDLNPSRTVNGSLWTLPVEFFCYLLLAALGALGLFKNRILAASVAFGVAFIFAWNRDILPLVALPPEAWMFPLFFFIGAFLAANKKILEINGNVILGCFLLAFLARKTPYYSVLLPLAIFIFLLYTSGLPVIRKIRLPGDFSYGVYLYGFPAQQVSKSIFPDQGVHANQIVGFGLALTMGVLSWFIVEKPSISLGRRLRSYILSK